MKIALIISAISLASRLLSLVSVQVYMAFFGPQTPQMEVYTFALNIPNIIFNVLGTSITAIVVPIYSSLIEKNKEEAKTFVIKMFLIVMSVVLIFMAIGFIIAPILVGATYFTGYYETFAITALRIMLFSMFFYGLNYLLQGVLHSHNKFLLAAVVTIPTSIVIISYTLILGEYFGVYGLIYATVIAFSLQGIILAPKALKLIFSKNYKVSNIKNFKTDENIKKAKKMLGPLIISASSFQIMSIFNTTMATHFRIATIQAFVMNLVLVASLSVIYSITSVYLPKLSILYEKDRNEYEKTLYKIINIILVLMIPASILFVFLRVEIISLLVKWGNFGIEEAYITANLLGIFGLAAAPLGIKEACDRAYYAQKNSKTPSIFGFFIMLVAIVFTLSLINIFEVYTMAIAYVVGFSIGSLCLLISLKIKLLKVLSNLIKIIFCAICMAIVLILVPSIYISTTIIFLDRLLTLAIPSVIGILAYSFLMFIVYKITKSEN